MSACRDFREALSAHLDGELGAADEAALRTHLETCADCAEALRGLRALSGALSGLPPVDASPQFEARFWARLARERDAAPSFGDRLLHWLRPSRIGVGLAGAAACALAVYMALPRGAEPLDGFLLVDSESYELLQEEELELLEVMEILEAWDGTEGV